MSFFNRAIKYLFRKRKKSIILLSILTTINLMLLISINILNTTNSVIDYIKLQTNTQLIVSNYTDLEEIEELKLESILKLDNVHSMARYGTSNATPMDFIPNNNGTLSGNELDNMVVLLAYDDITLDAKFLDNIVYLTDGTKELNNSIIINYLLAEENNLHIGDKVHFKSFDNNIVEVAVGGFFKATENESSQSSMIANIYRIENSVYMDYDTAKKILGENLHCDTYWFNLKDPDLKEDTISDLQEILGSKFNIKISDSLYNSLVTSMNEITSVIKIMIIFCIITAVCSISILLSMWIKSRLKEICILSVVGNSKLKIILQFVCESLILFFIALLISIAFSNLLLGFTYQKLFQDNLLMYNIIKSLKLTDVFFTGILGISILITCTLISVFPVFKIKPRKILSMTD